MPSKSKKVTYEDRHDDDTTDYLDPSPLNHPPKKPPPPPISYYGSLFFLISILHYISVPITQFIIGIISVGQCPIRQFLPIYMILSGIFGIAFVLVGVILFWQCRRCDLSYKRPPAFVRALKPLLIFLFLFVLGWWITGHVLVFDVKTRVDLVYPILPEYCQVHLYKAAYVLVFINYIILLVAILLAIIRRIIGGNGK